jgi:hypothetical protein
VTLADIPCLGPTRAPEIVVSNYDPATLEAINKELGAICKLLLDMDAKNYSPGSVKYLPSC